MVNQAVNTAEQSAQTPAVFMVGDKKLNKQDFTNNLNKGTQIFLDAYSNSWGKENTQLVQGAVSELLDAYNKNQLQILKDDNGNSYIHLDGIQLPQYEEGQFNPYEAAAYMITSTADSMPAIKEDTSKKSKRKYLSNTFSNNFLKTLTPTGEFNSQYWLDLDEENDTERPYTNRLTRFNKFLESELANLDNYDEVDSAFGDKDQLRVRIQDLQSRLADGNISAEDKLAMTALGFNPELFSTGLSAEKVAELEAAKAAKPQIPANMPTSGLAEKDSDEWNAGIASSLAQTPRDTNKWSPKSVKWYFDKNGNKHYVVNWSSTVTKTVTRPVTKTVDPVEIAKQRYIADDWRTEDTIRATAMAEDIGAFVASFAPGYGTATAGALGLTSMITNAIADKMDPSVSTGEWWRNLGANLGLGVLGLVPGGKSVGLLKNLAHFAPRVIGVISSAGILTDKDTRNSWNKVLQSGEDAKLTVEDWKNIGKSLTAVATMGVIGNSAVKNYRYKSLRPTVEKKPITETKSTTEKPTTKQETKQTTEKPANEAKSTTENKTEAKSTTEKPAESKSVANKAVETAKQTIESAKQKGKGFINKVINKVTPKKTETVVTPSTNPRAKAMERLNNIRKLRHPRLSKFMNTDYDIYVNNAAPLRVPGVSEKTKESFAKIREKVAPKWDKPVKTQNNNTTENSNPVQNTKQPATKKSNSKASPKPKFKEDPVINLDDNSLKFYARRAAKSDSKIMTDELKTILNKKSISTDDRKQLRLIVKNALTTKTLNRVRNLAKSKGTKSEKEGGTLVKEFKSGGIVSAANGTQFINPYLELPEVPDWYLAQYPYQRLKGWNNRLDQSKAGPTITTPEAMHYNASDLRTAYGKNDAYTGRSNIVGQDIQSYANTLDLDDIQALVNQYNKDAGTIRGHWATEQTYGLPSAKEHNQLFRRMFANRSGSGKELYDIGYDEGNEAIEGSSTWLRRMDTYKDAMNFNDPDHLNSRIHKVTLKNGKTGYVYKKQNGDIDIVPEEVLRNIPYDVLNPSSESTNLIPRSQGDESTLNPETPTFVPEIDNREEILGRLTGLGLRTSRLLNNIAATSRRAARLRSALRSINMHDAPQKYHQIMDDYAGNQYVANQAAQLQNHLARPVTSDASLNTARMLEGQTRANAMNQEQAVRNQDMIQKHIQTAENYGNENAAARVALANDNGDRLYQLQQMLGNVDQQESAANQTSVNNAEMENEKEYREYLNDRLALIENAKLNQLGSLQDRIAWTLDNDVNYQKARQAYSAAINETDPEKQLSPEEIEELATILSRETSRVQKEAMASWNQDYRTLFNIPTYRFTDPYREYMGALSRQYLKKGGIFESLINSRTSRANSADITARENLRARKSDNDRFMKSIWKAIDTYLQQSKRLKP